MIEHLFVQFIILTKQKTILMKALKSALAIFFVSFSIFISCVKTDVNPADLSDSAYTDLTFLATAHDSTQKDGKKGHGKITEVDASTLPASVKTYINTNYAGATLKTAGKTETGTIVVHIVLANGSSKGLKFDSAGVFISVKDHGKNKGEKVDIKDLPMTITDYIKANYATASIHKAFKSDTGSYGVVLKRTDDTKIILGFDATGKFLNELKHVKGEKGKSKKSK